jgi:sulfide dehydrogenase cytochrome subunit
VTRLIAYAALTVLASALAGRPTLAADRTGRVLALSCAACHGTSGKSPGSMPSLRGRSETFIAQALAAFKSGARKGTVMNRLARGYTDAEIKALARYYGRMNGVTPR